MTKALMGTYAPIMADICEGETSDCYPGYGLYDRALGVMYILGVWDTLERHKMQKSKVREHLLGKSVRV